MVVLSEPLGRLLLGFAAYLADQNDSLGLIVLHKPGQHIYECSSLKGVTADAHHCALSEANASGLVDCLVS